MTALLVIGGVLVVAAAVLGYLAKRSGDRREGLEAAPTVPCKDLADIAAVGATVVEVHGTTTTGSGAPLSSPLAGQPCVWYRSVVHELYREYEYRGTGDDRRRELVDKKRVRSDDCSPNPILIDDGTGTVAVEIDGCDIDGAVKVLDRRVDDDGSGRRGLSIDIGPIALGSGEGTYGYEQEEHTIPVGQRLFAIGTAAPGPRLVRPADRSAPFLVSTRDEAQLHASAVSSERWLKLAAGASAVIGVVLLVAGALA